MRPRNSVRYQKLPCHSRRASDSSDESSLSKNHNRAVVKRRLSIPERFVNRYFPEGDAESYDCTNYRNLWSTCPLKSGTMVSRRKILSRSRDGLNSDFPDEDDDIWFQKERLVKDHIQEVLNKWKQIDDEIWAKIIVMERNRRVAKAYARAPVLTINGSDDGFDGYRIGLCGFDNPMRDAKTEEIRKHIGHGIKIKMDDGGNIMVKRISRSNIFVKEIKVEEPNQPDDTPSGNVLEMEKPVKIFDMKKFADSVNMELEKAYPDRRKLESKCISAISFVKDSPEILDCPCWVMIINIVALDMLRTKLPPASKSSIERMERRQFSQEEDPYSIPFTMSENSVFNMDTFRDPKPPKLPPRDIEKVPVPTPDYDDWKPEKPKNKKPQQFGYKDDPYYCGMRARVPNFRKKTTIQPQLSDSAVPVRKSHSSGYLGFLRQGDGSLDCKKDGAPYADDEYFRTYGRMRSAPSHSLSQGMYIGEWE